MPASTELEIPSDIRAVFGKPPIVVGEEPAEYQKLMGLVIADVKPQALREWLLTKDIVDAEWEILRLRGLKVGMLQAFVAQALAVQNGVGVNLLSKTAPALRKHVLGVAAGDKGAEAALEELLRPYGLTLDLLLATAFERTIGPQLHADRMAEAAYERRNAAYVLLEGLRDRRERAAAAAALAGRRPSAKTAPLSVEAPPIVPESGVTG